MGTQCFYIDSVLHRSNSRMMSIITASNHKLIQFRVFQSIFSHFVPKKQSKNLTKADEFSGSPSIQDYCSLILYRVKNVQNSLTLYMKIEDY